MGICIYLNVSTSVTKKEWAKVYEETERLIEHFPLAKMQKVNIHGANSRCLVKTESDEHGWRVDGDMESMQTVETRIGKTYTGTLQKIRRPLHGTIRL